MAQNDQTSQRHVQACHVPVKAMYQLVNFMYQLVLVMDQLVKVKFLKLAPIMPRLCKQQVDYMSYHQLHFSTQASLDRTTSASVIKPFLF